MPIDEGILSSVAIGNVKTIAEAGAHAMALAMQNGVAHQNRLNILAETALSQAIKGLQEVDPLEAISVVKALTGNDVAAQIQSLLAAIASGQIGSKSAGNTPPVTP